VIRLATYDVSPVLDGQPYVATTADQFLAAPSWNVAVCVPVAELRAYSAPISRRVVLKVIRRSRESV
jgi:hypothetical protein